MKKGIDISSHNGTIDMKKVKENGIEFIILRLGYGKHKSQIDTKFYENYYKSLDLNIPIGIYLYSYALNCDDALQEAKLVINEINNLKIEYPVFLDMEEADSYKSRNKIDNSTCIDICETFCKFVEEQGYYAGIYANLDWLNNKINDKKLDRFDKWVAQWNDSCSYKGDYGMWQYSSKGSILGISGFVDLNYSLKDYPTIIKNAKLNRLNLDKTTYVVQPGDNLTTIAQKFNTNWEAIYQKNKNIIGINPNIIKVGQVLIIKEEK